VATAADFFITGGVGGSWIDGTAKVNGVAGYTFELAALDSNPDAFNLSVWSPAGVTVYSAGGALHCGSITIK
jgi:hypothetical protein